VDGGEIHSSLFEDVSFFQNPSSSTSAAFTRPCVLVKTSAIQILDGDRDSILQFFEVTLGLFRPTHIRLMSNPYLGPARLYTIRWMAFLSPDNRTEIQELFKELDNDVNVIFFTRRESPLFIPGRECETCEDTRMLLEEIAALS